LKLPVFGKLIGRQELGRFALIIASLLRSGMELVEALAVAERSCRNRVLRLAIVQVRRDIEVGMGLKEAFQKHAVFPGTIAHIFSVGQQSGQMEPMLERLAKDYDRQAATLASRVTTVTEPVLIIVLALIVGFIMFATILPILEAGNVLME
jgi:general secretion pathway protein F